MKLLKLPDGLEMDLIADGDPMTVIIPKGEVIGAECDCQFCKLVRAMLIQELGLDELDVFEGDHDEHVDRSRWKFIERPHAAS